MIPIPRLKILVSIDETDTETNDTKSQASRQRRRWGSKDKIDPDTEAGNKHEGEKLSKFYRNVLK